jgi:glycine/D-amino acid oxidase-like deaminating enzyme
MANIARERGVEFHGRTQATGIEVEHGRVRAVVTQACRIRTPRLLLCAGIWGPRVGRLAGVPIPRCSGRSAKTTFRTQHFRLTRPNPSP